MVSTMKAVVFHGPLKVALEDRPIPKIQEATDVVVKVAYTALCGSELHVFRVCSNADFPELPVLNSETGFIMGHEFTGFVHEIGSAVKTFKEGDHVVCPFTVSCSECFYCREGHTSRCVQSKLLGSTMLDGAQAEYIRIPLADASLVKAPETISDKALILMADIFPTGFFGAQNAFKHFTQSQISNLTVAVIGCGPVGLCALINVQEYKPKHILAIDSIPSRLEQAKVLGAEPWNFKDNMDGLRNRIKELTDGRGLDAAIEVVGLSPALGTAFELVRPWGVVSSIGVHNAEVPFTAKQAYDKNIRLQFGRCPVRAIFPEALDVLQKNQDRLGFMTDKIMPLADAVEGYDLFNSMKAQKVVFTTTSANRADEQKSHDI